MSAFLCCTSDRPRTTATGLSYLDPVGLDGGTYCVLAVNLAGTYSPKATQSGANMNQGIVSYETSMSQYAIDLGVGWKF